MVNVTHDMYLHTPFNGLRKISVASGSFQYTLYFIRKGNYIGIMYIYPITKSITNELHLIPHTYELTLIPKRNQYLIPMSYSTPLTHDLYLIRYCTYLLYCTHIISYLVTTLHSHGLRLIPNLSYSLYHYSY